jgi:hypothetical protein
MKQYNIVRGYKFDLRKGTVVAFIGGVFVVGSEFLETLVPVQSTILGVVVAVAILLLLRPLQILVLHLAGEDSPEQGNEPQGYLESRKLEVYRAAVRGAVEDGIVTRREESILVHLRDNLHLSDAEVKSVEQEFKAYIR